MGINKIIYNTTTLIDLSEDTVSPENLITGYTAHDKTGEQIVGVAAGIAGQISTLEEFKENYSEDSFLLSYINATTGTQYITNDINSKNGVFIEDTLQEKASRWYFEQVSGYTDRFYIYTLVNDEKQYMYNNTSSGANFMGLSTTSKSAFDITCEANTKFLLKISTKNAWLQHSNSGGGVRLYTTHTDNNNCWFSFTYSVNAIVPYGTLTITENGTYDITNYKQVIVNIN